MTDLFPFVGKGRGGGEGGGRGGRLKTSGSVLEECHSTLGTMEFRAARLVCVLMLLVHGSFQQGVSRMKEGVKKDVDSTLEDLQTQINDITQELNLLKEKQALQTVCLKGVKVHGKCYLADPVRKRYHQANEDCIDRGGILSSPASAEYNDQLSAYVRQSIGPNEQIWLGINDMVMEGDWQDQAGVSILFKNWDYTDYRARQPDGGILQNCAALEAQGGKWSDENCREEKASVCEFNIV